MAVSHVYELSQELFPNPGTTFDIVSTFPWSRDYWKRTELSDETRRQRLWLPVYRRWCNVSAICDSRNHILLVRTLPGRPLQTLLRIDLKFDDLKLEGEKLRAITWALVDKSLNPLLVFAGDKGVSTSLIWKRENYHRPYEVMEGTHPRRSSIILSTSRDKSSRLWDLALDNSIQFVGAKWPRATAKYEQKLGPPFGHPMTDGDYPESVNLGRCFALFGGGTATEGHRATPLHSDWHPIHDLVATCGVDHAICIWAAPRPPPVGLNAKVELVNDYLPLFGTQYLHRAQVQCVYWLTENILVSQSTKSVVDPIAHIYAAEIVVWRWLAYESMFSEDRKERKFDKNKASYDSSRLFKVLTRIPIPESSRKMSFDGVRSLLLSTSFQDSDLSSWKVLVLDPSFFTRSEDNPVDVACIAHQKHPFFHEEDNFNEGDFEGAPHYPFTFKDDPNNPAAVAHAKRKQDREILRLEHGEKCEFDGIMTKLAYPRRTLKASVKVGPIILAIGDSLAVYQSRLPRVDRMQSIEV